MPESVTWRGRSQVTARPEMLAPEAVRELPGSWLFMGPLFGHLGHVLVESISHLWALDHPPEPA